MRERAREAAAGPAAPRPGSVAPELTAEFGELSLWHVTVPVARDAARWGRERLHRLSDGYRPTDALRDGLRSHAHTAMRVFARQVGLDPDAPLFRADAVAREAAVAGRLVSHGAVADARLAVAVTSGVPFVALDADTVDGEPGLRPSGAAERLGAGRRATALPAGTLVIADRRRPLATLFADPPAAHDARRARRVLLYAIGVPGAPPAEVSEAVWHTGRFLTGT